MAEQDRRTSPYAYGFDDPIRHTDPDGMFGEDFDGGGEEEGGPGPRSISLSKATQPTGSRAGNIFKNTLKASGAAIAIGLGPEDPVADVVAGGILAVGGGYALGTLIYDHLKSTPLSSTQVQSSDSKSEKHTSDSKNTKDTKGQTKGSLSETKKALADVKKKLGLEPDASLPKQEQGKFGSPQRGDSKKGYRLDPAHPNALPGTGEEYPHINWWDYSGGKRKSGNGDKSGAIPIIK